jgi:hypothetical protein
MVYCPFFDFLVLVVFGVLVGAGLAGGVVGLSGLDWVSVGVLTGLALGVLSLSCLGFGVLGCLDFLLR